MKFKRLVHSALDSSPVSPVLPVFNPSIMNKPLAPTEFAYLINLSDFTLEYIDGKDQIKGLRPRQVSLEFLFRKWTQEESQNILFALISSVESILRYAQELHTLQNIIYQLKHSHPYHLFKGITHSLSLMYEPSLGLLLYGKGKTTRKHHVIDVYPEVISTSPEIKQYDDALFFSFMTKKELKFTSAQLKNLLYLDMYLNRIYVRQSLNPYNFIADQLGIGYETVKTHFKKMREKTSCGDYKAIYMFAQREGYIELAKRKYTVTT